jgi:hypothetical protein
VEPVAGEADSKRDRACHKHDRSADHMARQHRHMCRVARDALRPECRHRNQPVNTADETAAMPIRASTLAWR